MKPCDLRRCNEWTTEEFCFYHDKLARGLIWPDDALIRRAFGLRHTTPIDVTTLRITPFSDEHRELARLLLTLLHPDAPVAA